MKFHKLTCLIFASLNLIIARSQANKSRYSEEGLRTSTSQKISDGKLCFFTTLSFDNKNLQIVHVFRDNGQSDQKQTFYIKDFIKTYFIYDNDTLSEYHSLIDYTNCATFPALFQGDSIDNNDGYIFRKLQIKDASLFMFTGYYLGCNGSFCDNESLLLIQFDKEKITSINLVGINKSMINISETKINYDSNFFQLEMPGYEDLAIPTYKAEKVRLNVTTKGLRLIPRKSDTSVFCIK